MRGKKLFCVLLAVCMLLGVSACAGDRTAVYVQSVAELADLGGIAPGDRFGGIVVSEHVAEIRKDEDKAVEELYVSEGEDVTAGQVLFSYDMNALQLSLDKLRLEQEQLEAAIENYTQQIAELEEERSWYAGTSDELEYTVQIQTLQVDLKEAELNLEAKKKEVAQAEALVENADVTSPVDGRVQSINETGMDAYGNSVAYITIQQTGAFRIKGILGELQRGSIYEGVRLRAISRIDESQVWTGTVTLVDYENPSQGNEYDMYYGSGSDEMTSSSRYPFYMELDSTEGLMLGQHVYLELETEEAAAGLQLSSAFFCYEEDGSVYVWAEGRNKLEKRTVTLGDYNEMTDTFAVLEGLSEVDYIAFPDPELCVPGAPVTRTEPAAEEEAVTE